VIEMMAVSEEMVREEEERLEKRGKCHYFNIICVRMKHLNRKPVEGSPICTNCLLAGLLKGIAEQIGHHVGWLLAKEE